MIERIQSLCTAFTRLTGNQVIQTYATQGEAREWLNAGFTEDDLALKVRYRKATVDKKDGHILKAMLRWRFIIGDVQRFAEDLPEAKAWAVKHRKVTGRDEAVTATGRPLENRGNEPRTAAQVMSQEGFKAFEEFKAFRKQLEAS